MSHWKVFFVSCRNLTYCILLCVVKTLDIEVGFVNYFLKMFCIVCTVVGFCMTLIIWSKLYFYMQGPSLIMQVQRHTQCCTSWVHTQYGLPFFHVRVAAEIINVLCEEECTGRSKGLIDILGHFLKQTQRLTHFSKWRINFSWESYCYLNDVNSTTHLQLLQIDWQADKPKKIQGGENTKQCCLCWLLHCSKNRANSVICFHMIDVLKHTPLGYFHNAQ